MKSSDILDLLQNSPSPMTKRDLARALGVTGSGPRVVLKKIVRGLEKEGTIIKHPGGGYTVAEGLPSVMILEVTDLDIDGDVFATPVEWNEATQGPKPLIELKPGKKGHPAAGQGDRILARIERRTSPDGEDLYIAFPIRRLDDDRGRVIGIFELTRSGRGVVRPTDKKAKHDLEIPSGDTNGAREGDLVIAEIQPSRTQHHKKARILNVLGKRDDVNAISLISLYEAGLRDSFPDTVIKASEGMKVPPLKGREDLRDVPLVTIDGADARDFDDAVYAEPLDDGGFHLIVAIADVSYYVRTGTPLDDEAQKRGNSTYFPDRVVPMLPEALSNDLCSLRPKENRAVMVAHMWIDKTGKLTKYKFNRGIIRSAARLIYEQVQAAKDGQTDDTTGPLMERVINPLYAAYDVLDKARQKRGALDLDLPERQILIDKTGKMTGVKKRERLDAHKLIEEFMVLANVAAARALEDKHKNKDKDAAYPCVYRIHDRPAASKVDGARDFIESFGLSLPKGQINQPSNLNGILTKASTSPYSHLISIMILRCQSQALYSTENIGHFGLALDSYAHFTSPIRRYADLLVHRSLVSAYNLGEGGLSDNERQRINSICEHISQAERNSMVAERSATDRFTSSYLASHIGAEFTGQISGVTRFGLFVELEESGADGLVPMRSLPSDYYIHDEDAHALIGRRHKRVYRLGAPIKVMIKEADPITGSSVFNVCPPYDKGADIPGMALNVGKPDRRRPKNDGKKGPPKGKKPFKKGKKNVKAKTKPKKR
ncbi:MAG: ribonuclease R [Alphaproteobacteria bacterium]|nr:ribonuclease R [Alphaproteobacteria bacterium]|tara:strand:+ start:1048 stop:3363 length:2316 start_codon:yes stop_codon:yes gene_type:complete